MHTLPGLTETGAWVLPARLNMAAQVLAGAGDGLAIIDMTGGARRDVSRAALSARTQALAAGLRAQGVGRGDRVGVLFGQSVDCVASHLAAWWIGAISVPLFKLFQHDALQSRIADAGVSLVLTDAAGRDQLGDLARGVLPDDIAIPGADVPMAETGPEDPAIIIYTSGTTGAPKGALHGHRVLTGHLPGVVMSHDYLGQQGDCLWTPADWAWIGGLFDVALPGLALGVPVVAARFGKFTPEAARDLIAATGIRNVFFPPTALRMLKAADCALPGLRSVASGGEPLGAEMLDWGRGAFGVTINEFYGQTECNMTVSSCAAAFTPEPGAMGRAVPGHDLQIIDDAGQVTKGEGDIAVRRGSASMMLRYWSKPEETAAKFRGDWMVTGDRGQRDGETLRFVGREDDVITSAGYRIGPAEIEDCLLTHPAIATVGVVGKPDPLRTEIVKAYVVLKPGAEATAESLQEWVRTRLASYSYPREVAFLDALPMTVTGKVIRKALKARAMEETA